MPVQALQHREHRGHEVAGGRALAVCPRHQMHRDLAVGVTGELDTLGLQFGPQHREVLDDAVVHHGEAARGIPVRVGIAVGGPAVGRPAGVPHPRAALQGYRIGERQRLLEVGQPSCPPPHRHPAVAVEHRHPRRVVAAVLHPAQRVDDDVTGRTLSDVADDSAHGSPG